MVELGGLSEIIEGVDRRVLIGGGIVILALILIATYFLLAGPGVREYTLRVLVNGKPVAGVKVTVEFPDGTTETHTTDERGIVTFEGPPGAKVVRVSGGYEATLPVDASVGEINLSAPKKSVTISVEDEEGNPLTARVTIMVNEKIVHEEEGNTITYDVEALPDDRVKITAEKNGYEAGSIVRTFKALPQRIVLTLRKPETERERYGAIVVLARDASGVGVDGTLRVYVKGSDVPVQEVDVSDGFASVEGLQFGTYVVKLFVNGVAVAEKEVVLDKESVEVDINAELVSADSARVVVVDKTNNIPIAGATIEVTARTTYTVETGKDGSATIGLGEGECADLLISAEGYKKVTDTVCAGEEKNIALEKLSTSGTLTVHVYNQLGQPVPNAQVYLESDGHVVGQPAITDDGGVVRLEGIEPGTYVVKAVSGSYTGASNPVEVLAGKTKSVDVYLFAGEANVTLTVLLDGSPASVDVEVYANGQKLREGKTNVEGNITFSLPANVDVRFHVYGSTTFVSRPYRFVPNESTHVTINVPSDFSGVKVEGIYSDGSTPVEGIEPGKMYTLRFLYKVSSQGKVVVAVTDGYWGVSLLGSGWTFRGWESSPGDDPITEALQSTAEGKSIAIKDAVQGAIVEDEIAFQTSSMLTGDYVTLYVGVGGAEDSLSAIVGSSMECTDTLCYSAHLVQNGEVVEQLKADYPAEVRVTVFPKSNVPGLRASVVYKDSEGEESTLCTLQSIETTAEQTCQLVPKEGAVQIVLKVQQCSGVCETLQEIPLITTQAVGEHKHMGMIVSPNALVASRTRQTINVTTFDQEMMEEKGLVPVEATVYVYAYVATPYQTYKMFVASVPTLDGKASIRITPAKNWDHVEIVARARDYDEAKAALSMVEHAVDVQPEDMEVDLTSENNLAITITNEIGGEVTVTIITGETPSCLSVSTDKTVIDLKDTETVNVKINGGEACGAEVDVPLRFSVSYGGTTVETLEKTLRIHPLGKCITVDTDPVVALSPTKSSIFVTLRNRCNEDVSVHYSISSDSASFVGDGDTMVPGGGEEQIEFSLNIEGALAHAEGDATVTVAYTTDAGEQTTTKTVHFIYTDLDACASVPESVAGYFENDQLVAQIPVTYDNWCKQHGAKLSSVSGCQGMEQGGVVTIRCDVRVPEAKKQTERTVTLNFSTDQGSFSRTVTIAYPPLPDELITLNVEEGIFGKVIITNNTGLKIPVTITFDKDVYYRDVSETIVERFQGGVSALEDESVPPNGKIELEIAPAEKGVSKITVTVNVKGTEEKHQAALYVESTDLAKLGFVQPGILWPDYYERIRQSKGGWLEPINLSELDNAELVSLCKEAWCTCDEFASILKEIRERWKELNPQQKFLAQRFWVVYNGRDCGDLKKPSEAGFYWVHVTWEESGGEVSYELSWTNLCTEQKAACQTFAKNIEEVIRTLGGHKSDLESGKSFGPLPRSNETVSSPQPVVALLTEQRFYITPSIYYFQLKDVPAALKEGCWAVCSNSSGQADVKKGTKSGQGKQDTQSTISKDSICWRWPAPTDGEWLALGESVAFPDVLKNPKDITKYLKSVQLSDLKQKDNSVYVVLPDAYQPVSVSVTCEELGATFGDARYLCTERGSPPKECSRKKKDTTVPIQESGVWLCDGKRWQVCDEDHAGAISQDKRWLCAQENGEWKWIEAQKHQKVCVAVKVKENYYRLFHSDSQQSGASEQYVWSETEIPEIQKKTECDSETFVVCPVKNNDNEIDLYWYKGDECPCDGISALVESGAQWSEWKSAESGTPTWVCVEKDGKYVLKTCHNVEHAGDYSDGWLCVCGQRGCGWVRCDEHQTTQKVNNTTYKCESDTWRPICTESDESIVDGKLCWHGALYTCGDDCHSYGSLMGDNKFLCDDDDRWYKCDEQQKYKIIIEDGSVYVYECKKGKWEEQSTCQEGKEVEDGSQKVKCVGGLWEPRYIVKLELLTEGYKKPGIKLHFNDGKTVTLETCNTGQISSETKGIWLLSNLNLTSDKQLKEKLEELWEAWRANSSSPKMTNVTVEKVTTTQDSLPVCSDDYAPACHTYLQTSSTEPVYIAFVEKIKVPDVVLGARILHNEDDKLVCKIASSSWSLGPLVFGGDWHPAKCTKYRSSMSCEYEEEDVTDFFKEHREDLAGKDVYLICLLESKQGGFYAYARLVLEVPTDCKNQCSEKTNGIGVCNGEIKLDCQGIPCTPWGWDIRQA